MSIISKQLSGFIFNGAALALASAPWKNNVQAIYGFNALGNGYEVFKPTSQFNSLTQLSQDGVYIVQAVTLGFELPGAVLTAGATRAAAGVLTLDSFAHSSSGQFENISLQVSSSVATDKYYLVVFDSSADASFKLALGDGSGFSLSNLVAGQVITMTAVAPSGARLTHVFTAGTQ